MHLCSIHLSLHPLDCSSSIKKYKFYTFNCLYVRTYAKCSDTSSGSIILFFSFFFFNSRMQLTFAL